MTMRVLVMEIMSHTEIWKRVVLLKTQSTPCHFRSSNTQQYSSTGVTAQTRLEKLGLQRKGGEAEERKEEKLRG